VPDQEIVNHYKKYFRMVVANTNQLRYQEYSLRYQVYCEEFGFEKIEDFPTHIETDQCDDYAKHCVLIHKPSNRIIGCLRLIIKAVDKDKFLLPIESYCNTIDLEKFDFSKLRGKRLGEFSRLAVIADFRRRRLDRHTPDGFYSHKAYLQNAYVIMGQNKRSYYPIIPISLALAGLVMGLESELDHSLAIMEPRLAVLLSRHNIYSERIGGLMDFHGQRAPYELLPLITLFQLNEERKALAQAIAYDLGSSFAESMDSALAKMDDFQLHRHEA